MYAPKLLSLLVTLCPRACYYYVSNVYIRAHISTIGSNRYVRAEAITVVGHIMCARIIIYYYW